MRITQSVQHILGKSFTDDLTTPVLVIGKDTWSQRELATGLGITNTVAARKLSAFVKQRRYKDVQDMYDSTSPYSFADTTLGVTCLYVMFAAFDAMDLNIPDWYTKKSKDEIVRSFLYFKSRETKARRRMKRSA